MRRLDFDCETIQSPDASSICDRSKYAQRVTLVDKVNGHPNVRLLLDGATVSSAAGAG